MSRQPAGPALLALLSLGLLSYGLWRVLQAIGGGGAGGKKSALQRAGWAASGALYFSLLAQAVSLIAGSGGSGGPSSHPSPLVARVLGWPGGPEWVGLGAVALVAGGVVLAIWGFVHDLGTVMHTERMGKAACRTARVTGGFGDATRGLLVALIGVYLMVAAATGDSSHVRRLDQVLASVAHHSDWAWVIGLAATGLLAFAVYSVVEAVYRRI